MFRKILLAALGILILMQVFKIDKTNPDINPEHDLFSKGNLSPEIGTLLKQACIDCHSNYTTYPWYTNVEPFSWFVKGHIKYGRQKLNFSEWYAYKDSKKQHKIEDCIEVLEQGRMPLKSYTWMHPKARLTDDQRTDLIDFFKSLSN